MGKCNFPGCNNESDFLFQCNRCDPPKFYCDMHRLPPNHGCVGIKTWIDTPSPVAKPGSRHSKGGRTIATEDTVGTDIPLKKKSIAIPKIKKAKSLFGKHKKE
jgi:hypothetical protein